MCGAILTGHVHVCMGLRSEEALMACDPVVCVFGQHALCGVGARSIQEEMLSNLIESGSLHSFFGKNGHRAKPDGGGFAARFRRLIRS